jgi:flagellar motor switch/type III secretory pathway protein FliN
MATTHSFPAPVTELASEPESAEAAAFASEEALVPSPHAPEHTPIALSPALALLPVELDVAIPVRAFRVRNLLALEPGQVLETQWGPGEDMPLCAGDVQLGWSEFDVVETALAVRLTRLA